MSERVLSPIRVTPSGRYFETFDGEPFLFIGFNDAIAWPRLAGLFRRKDVASVDAYLQLLAAQGVTIIRLMLEYAHHDSHYFERPVGCFNPNITRFWDDLFARCARYGLRVLLTPWDTFWMSRRWHKHPYNTANGGPAQTPQDVFLNEATIQATIRRLHYVIERWGRNGALAAWDLCNEIHPYWGGTPAQQGAVIARISEAVRSKEQEMYGYTRPQTVSVFGPDPGHEYEDLIFRHPSLDFATTHIYSKGAIDYPRNTITSAVTMAQWTRHGLERAPATRPFTDSEHGPIHLFNDHKKTLPEAFDDEYERHLMWTHLACGGAGSGMRWPARHPHVITDGTLRSLKSMSAFTQWIDWRHFTPHEAADEVTIRQKGVLVFGCADGRKEKDAKEGKQAVLYLLRGNPVRNTPGITPLRDAFTQIPMTLRGMTPGDYTLHLWDTLKGCEEGRLTARADAGGRLQWTLPHLGNDLAIAIRFCELGTMQIGGAL